MIVQYENYIAQRINGSVVRSGFIQDVYSFPAIGAQRYTAERTHLGANKQEHTLRFFLRGFVQSSMENCLRDTDALAKNIETYTQTFVHDVLVQLALDLELITIDGKNIQTQDLRNILARSDKVKQRLVRDARVLRVETDEGFMAPYGMCELEIEFEYDYTNRHN